MAITKEKFEILANYMGEDDTRAKALTSVSAEEACRRINADGFDFTADELLAFAEIVEKASDVKQGELNESDLDNVSGGILVSTIVAGVWYCAFVSVSAACAQEWLRRR